MPFIPIFRISLTYKALLLLGVVSLCCGGLRAQQPLDFRLRAVLSNTPENKFIHLAARGDADRAARAVKQLGGQMLHRHRELITFRIASGKVLQLANEANGFQLEFGGHRGKPLNDSMLVNNRVSSVYENIGNGLGNLRGRDVIIGLVDTGIELQHPDFQHADSTTRVVHLWDQTQTGTPPTDYGYGAEWSEQDINNGITGHQDQPQYYGHGSTVTGTAAGNGLATGANRGVAPEADLIVVSSQFNAPNWTLTVADAIEYIFNKADELNKPAVVNLSLGSYTGSHDGRDAAALIIDSLIAAKPGRGVVCASGNSGNWPAYHLGYSVTADTAFTWFRHNPNSDVGPAVFFELWADTADFQDVSVAIGADRVNPSLSYRGRTDFRQVEELINQTISDTLLADGNILGVVDYYAELRGGQYKVQVQMAAPDSSDYNFRFITTGSGRFDCWSSIYLGSSSMIASNLPSAVDYPDINHYRLPDKNKHMVSSWAASPEVITVGNYNNRDQYIDYNGNLQTFDPPAGELSINSSHGPTRDGRQKPEVAASGDLTMSSGKFSVLASMINNEPHKVAPGGMHYRNGGTSMASPVVSGAAALLMEMCPNADWETIRNAIISNTYLDSYATDSTSNSYGTGKLDVEAAVASLAFQPEFLQPTDTLICEGEELTLSLADSYETYAWSNGQESSDITTAVGGSFSVEVVNSLGCRGKSDTVYVAVVPAPEVFIEQHMDTLLAAEYPEWEYQWFSGDGILVGENQFFFVPQENGIYYVEVTNGLGCSSVSNSLDVVVTSINAEAENEEWKVYPIPTRDLLFIEGTARVTSFFVYGADGRLQMHKENPRAENGRHTIDVSGLGPGVYLLQINLRNGVESRSFILR